MNTIFFDCTHLDCKVDMKAIIQISKNRRFQEVEQVSDLHAAHIIYQFTCSCSVTNIHRTDQCLGQRMREHAMKWLLKQMTHPSLEQKVGTNNPAYSVAKGLMTFNHQADPDKAFQGILRNSNLRLLAFFEVPSNTKLKTAQCVQKLLTYDVCLSWH